MKEKVDHTPEPWIVHSGHTVVPAADAHKCIGGSVDPDREAERCAKVIHGYGNCDSGTRFQEFHRSRTLPAEAIANARLIAAAPDLLEAARHAAMEWRLHGSLTDSCRVLEAAIVKAEAR